MICILRITKGHNSVKTIAGVMVLVLCTLPVDTLYDTFNEVSMQLKKISRRV